MKLDTYSEINIHPIYPAAIAFSEYKLLELVDALKPCNKNVCIEVVNNHRIVKYGICRNNVRILHCLYLRP